MTVLLIIFLVLYAVALLYTFLADEADEEQSFPPYQRYALGGDAAQAEPPKPKGPAPEIPDHIKAKALLRGMAPPPPKAHAAPPPPSAIHEEDLARREPLSKETPPSREKTIALGKEFSPLPPEVAREEEFEEGVRIEPIAGAAPSDPTSHLVFPVRTGVHTFLSLLMALGAGLGFAGLVFWFGGSETNAAWLIRDGLTILATSYVLWAAYRCEFRLDPSNRTLTYHSRTPLHYHQHEVSAAEVAAVAVDGRLKSWPLLVSVGAMEFAPVILFADGKTMPLGDFKGTAGHPLDAFAHHRSEAQTIARLLDCPFFDGELPPLATFPQWKKDLAALVPVQAASPKDPLLDRLWKAMAAGCSLEGLEPYQLKVDFSTRREKWVLAFLSVLFVASTVWLLVSEWQFLVGNPRLFYLVLLDSTSVVVTLLGLWHWLIDEYLVIDLETKTLYLSSRILFFRSRTRLGSTDQVERIVISRRSSRIPGFPVEFAAWIVMDDGARHQISDYCWSRSLTEFRAWHLARLLGCPFAG